MSDREASEPAKGPEPQAFEVEWAPHADVPIQSASGVVVNFIGSAFLVSFIQIRPPLYDEKHPLTPPVPGHVLFRAAVDPAAWVATVESLTNQVAKLRTLGLLPPAASTPPEGR